MSNFSLYFTRGTPRSTAPAFTLDFSTERELETVVERLYRQFTQGRSQPSQEPEQPNYFVTHGHTTFQQGEVEWVQPSEAIGKSSATANCFPNVDPLADSSNNLTFPSSTPTPISSPVQYPPLMNDTPSPETPRRLSPLKFLKPLFGTLLLSLSPNVLKLLFRNPFDKKICEEVSRSQMQTRVRPGDHSQRLRNQTECQSKD
ncbi:uncharacterized protein N7482_002343 [Penicillium canariense]|uniref:Uncharacterized protein n=1 Tax=Penicillium canariense TaxID=189055 RepID=A0A9W9LTX8_9EURO|nr:uncharacterized protein N7482_002343 [Penicillium canariense]KAJ5176466.1 hypothetical protein N7482_002343 [Penicillium canariense]